jgi:predicted MPP superfamily phosphohydrolase
MPLPGLGEGLRGFRITQVTDLHTGGTPVRYLDSVVDRVNDLPTDLVVITGDLVSSQLRWVAPACDVIARIRHPTLVTFGNHDYSTGHAPYLSTIVADALQRELDARRIEVLRNRAIPIERDGSRAWIVGLEDHWSGKFSPERAFAGVSPGEPAIALSHNPDTGPLLAGYGAHWILAGHTHGGQIRLPGIRPLMLPLRNKRFASGEFLVGKGSRKAHMYVSRGVGCRVPVRFRCPPEVTTFVLEPSVTE